MLQDPGHWWGVPKERRRFHRIPSDVPAALLSTALGRVAATVTDLSQNGCRLRTHARCHRGDTLVVTFGGMSPRAVIAAWRENGEMGFAFIDPLAWSIVATLAAATG